MGLTLSVKICVNLCQKKPFVVDLIHPRARLLYRLAKARDFSADMFAEGFRRALRGIEALIEIGRAHV